MDSMGRRNHSNLEEILVGIDIYIFTLYTVYEPIISPMFDTKKENICAKSFMLVKTNWSPYKDAFRLLKSSIPKATCRRSILQLLGLFASNVNTSSRRFFPTCFFEPVVVCRKELELR